MIDEEVIKKIQTQIEHVLYNYEDKEDMKLKLTDLILEWFYRGMINREQKTR